LLSLTNDLKPSLREILISLPGRLLDCHLYFEHCSTHQLQRLLGTTDFASPLVHLLDLLGNAIKIELSSNLYNRSSSPSQQLTPVELDITGIGSKTRP
jgi:hypothetical protein